MSKITLVPFERAHLEGAFALSKAEGWPQRLEDWALVQSLSTGVVALSGTRVVGCALRTDFGAGHATVNMVIVGREARGQGLGRRVLETVCDTDRALRLVATEAGRPVYEKLGFQTVAMIAQHQGVLGEVQATGRAESARPEDAAAIALLESDSFGAERSALSAWIAAQTHCAVIRRDGDVVGYASRRDFGRGVLIGPVVAETPEDAKALISYHLSALAGQFVRLDILEDSGVSDWLAAHGLDRVDGPPLMERGPKPDLKARVALFSQALV